MNYKKIYDAVKDEYSEDIALHVCIANAIHMNTDVEVDDMKESGRYQKRIEKQIRDVLWEYEDISLIIDLESKVYVWMLSHDLAGLGGCVPKLFKEIKGESSETI